MALNERSATWPWKGDRPVHLPRPEQMPRGFLLPGDPGRVDMAAAVLDDFAVVGQNREFRMGIGRWRGVEIGICSTGIGGASTEIAVVELAAMGATHLVRTGGMGAMAADLALGDFLIARAAIANSACARPYWPDDTDVPASATLTAHADAARRDLSLPGRLGVTATADGYYRAQGRPDHQGGQAQPAVLDALATRGADGMEMEAEVVFAVGAARGIDCAAVLAVHAHRRIDGWLEDYEETQRNILRIGAEALARALTST